MLGVAPAPSSSKSSFSSFGDLTSKQSFLKNTKIRGNIILRERYNGDQRVLSSAETDRQVFQVRGGQTDRLACSTSTRDAAREITGG